MQDRELLQAYVQKRSETAFAELVQRYVALVYSTARRLLGEAQGAQDVSQSVFIRLARKAGSVREGNALPGWLYRATCYEAASFMRTEKRRRQREAEAVKLAESESDPFSVWEAIGPLLDEAMNQLGRLDQDAVLLRFFENKPLSEVGQTLGLSEEAARKRVSRALEKLRAHFGRRGLKVSSALLLAAIAAHAVQAAPTAIASGLAAASLAGASTIGASGLILKLFQTIAMTKLKTTGVTALVMAAVCIPLVLHHSNRKLKLENDQLATQLRDKTSELTEAQTSLVRQIETLQSRLLESDTEKLTLRQQVSALQNRVAALSSAKPALSAPAPDTAPAENDFVRVKRANIANVHYDVLTPDLQLADTAIDLLELTLAESAQIKGAVGELRKKVQNHDLAQLKQVPPAEVLDADIVRFLAGKDGQVSTFRISPYAPEEQQTLRKGLEKDLQEIIGPQRSARFFENARYSLDFWFGLREDKLLALIDRADASGQPEREWMIKFNTASSQGSYSGKSPNTVPTQLRYLYDAAEPKPAQ